MVRKLLSTKLKGYTIMEVTVVMALSALCITIIYTAFNIISGSYRQFDRRNARVSELVLTDRVLRKDFSDSRFIKRSDDGLIFSADSGDIRYTLGNEFILRKQFSLRTDTLHVGVEEWNSGFRDLSSSPGTAIDRLNLTARVDGERIRLTYSKKYSSADLAGQSLSGLPNFEN